MTYKTEKGIFNIPDEEIQHNIKVLEISQEEAIELWLDDHDITSNEEQEALDAKAKGVKIYHGAASADKPKKIRTAAPKRKENMDKQVIIAAVTEVLRQKLDNLAAIDVRNKEKYVDFTWNDTEYTINLVAHRAKKEKK